MGGMTDAQERISAEQTKRRILYVLHMGLTELRLLARQPERGEQAEYLADVLEVMPGWLEPLRQEALADAISYLRGYEERFPVRMRDYTKFLDGSYEVPDRW
jgi:hypothetical protein